MWAWRKLVAFTACGILALIIAPTPAAAQLAVIQSGTTGGTVPGAVAYDPAHDAYLLVQSTGSTSNGPIGLFVSGFGTPQLGASPFAIGAGPANLLGVSVAYSPDMSDGAGGTGAFLVVWSSYFYDGNSSNYVYAFAYARAVAFPGRLVGPIITLEDWSGQRRNVRSVGVAYSQTDRVFLTAWENFQVFPEPYPPHDEAQAFFLRLNLTGQPIGGITAVSSPSPCVGCGRIDVVWNAPSNEFGLLYNDASMMFVRVRADGTVSSQASLGPAVPAHALAVNNLSHSYLAAVADSTTRTIEIDAGGAIGHWNTASATGATSPQQLALSHSPVSNTFLLAITGQAIELDEHGAAISLPLNFGSLKLTWPAIASRSSAPEWMVSTGVGFNRIGSGAARATYVRGDFTGDGQGDLVWQHADTGEVQVSEMNGLQDVGVIPVNGGTYWQVKAAADFTGDRKPDLLWQYPSTGEVLLWEMNGPAYVRSTILTFGGTFWRVVAAADFSGDGKADILWQMPTTGAVLLWVMDGPTYVASIILNAGGTYWQVAGAADFTGDGQTDILWQHPSTGALLLWQMSGATYVGSTLIGQPGTYWRVVAVGDYTQDGQPDIVWQAPWDGSVLIWTMNGTAYSGGSLISGPTPWQIKGPR
jgi:hypothetical protein